MVDLLNGTDLSWINLVSAELRNKVQVQGALDRTIIDKIRGTGNLHLPRSAVNEGCAGYWMATKKDDDNLWSVDFGGAMGFGQYYVTYRGVLPVVIIPVNQVTLTRGTDGVTTVTPKTN